MHRDTISRSTLAWVSLCFFLSGAAGLIYQVAWGKALGLIFGHTVYAIATVLAVFMGGLAAGSALLGRWSERHSRPVALYGWLELGVAATGALSVLGLAGVRALYLAAYPAVSGFTPALVALRFVASALVLFLPTFLMGGTLPILVRGLTRSSAELGARLGRLYWVNTSGAVAGTLAAGFLLLPEIGLKRTIAVAVALNLLAGFFALWLARRAPSSAIAQVVPSPRPPQRLSQFLLAGFALVGATAMAYEVAWSRLLATALSSSTYAFTLMLATFLAGIVLGSILFEWWARRGRPASLATFAFTQTLTALAALAFLVFFQRMPLIVPPILRATHETFTGLILAQFATSAAAMLPAAVIFGFNFPVATLLIAGGLDASGRHAAAVGRAYGANTLGAILGAGLTGFALVPLLGSYRVVALAAAANLALAVLLQLRRLPRRPFPLAANLALLVFVAWAGWTGRFYDRALAHFGTVLYWDLYESPLTVPEIAATTDLLFAEDGLNASIAVARAEDYLALRTNGKVDASSNDRVTQLLTGHLGAIFHPAPRRVLVIGFGSGMTLSALARYPEVERIDCVEIEPAVIRAAAYLEPLHRGVLRDPRLRIILDDGRNFLLTTRQQYDLIISEPSNPWIAGIATLFTEEFYREIRAHLAPGGVFVQWIQAYALQSEDLRMVFASLVPHFPRVTLWRGDYADLFLLAQTDTSPLTLDRLRALWSNPALREDFELVGMRQPEGIVAFHRLDDPDLRRIAAAAPRNTDDHTRLEYRAPRSLLITGLMDKNSSLILQFRSAILPRDLRLDDPDLALLAAADTLLNLEESEEAGFFASSLPDDPSNAVALLRGRWELQRGKLAEARDAFQLALQLDRTSIPASHGLAEVARRRADYDTAELLLLQVLGRAPHFLPALESMVRVQRARAAWHNAAEWQQRRIAADPRAKPADSAELGEFLLRAGEREKAEGILLATLERDPYTYTAHRQLGEMYLEQARWEQARLHLEAVVRFSPVADSGAYLALADAYRALGRTRDAVRTLRKGARLFPADTSLQRAASAT